ncbi:virulence factor TspB C-terminal domain-related protein [Acinetobacter sp. c2-A9]|uniref:virulence factor TspB C-terminal domain-related protein n=1 Tax=Acinetobacter sp. c2-A9 TaxID=3342802 RepID=UPI0035BB2E0C
MSAPQKTHMVTVAGYTAKFEISYQKMCDFFVSFKPFGIGLSTLSGVMIVAGVGRKNG